jgi:hypothetical protein
LSLYSEYANDPRKALEMLFEKEGHLYNYHGKGPALFLWQGGKDSQGTRYGSYRIVYLNELKEREYEVEWADYRPSIRYTDVVFNPKIGKYENAS